jgi:YidC/Oxa1 family membrane protein insertase
MDSFFNFFGSIFGYVLWWFYLLIPNYGVAIILFTVVFKLLLFPFSIKQQRSMAASGKMQIKIKNLQKRYADDKQRLQIETQKLYEKEGLDPMGGCSTMLLPLLVMFGLYYTVLNPLSNALHLSSDAITKAINIINQIPGSANTAAGRYAQIEIVHNFANLKPYLTMFSADELSRLQSFSHGFRFLGLDLLGTPCDPGNIFGTLFNTNLWIIPVLCLVSSIVTQFFTMKLQPIQQKQGCMTFTFYFMALFTAWLACTVPAAVGFYWILSTFAGLIQTIVLFIQYSPEKLNAETEARRIALREQQEAAVKPLGLQQQMLLQKKLAKPEKRGK